MKPGRVLRRPAADAVITTARHGRSSDLTRRQRHYVITMSFRIACFVAMVFVPGPARIGLLVAAAILPAIAVLFANAVDRRSHHPDPIETGSPGYHRALEQHPTEVVRSDVVED